MAKTQAGEPPEAPKPPEIRRRIAFNPTQAIGMPFILLIPILGLLGFFDTNHVMSKTEQEGIGLSVRYSSRFRHKTGEPMQIKIENNTGGAIPKLVVKVSSSYFNAFENVQFLPEPNEIDRDSMKFEFDNVKPGDTRQVEIEMEASQSGSHTATVEAGPEDAPGASLKVETFVLP